MLLAKSIVFFSKLTYKYIWHRSWPANASYGFTYSLNISERRIYACPNLPLTSSEATNMSNIVHSPSHLRKLKGQTLSRFDSEQKMLSSGPLGTERLIMNIALDFMEKHPHMSWPQAIFAAQAYFDRTHN